MQSKIRRKPVHVRPSRIRREPVRTVSAAELRKTEAKAREREMWGGVAGIALFGAAVAVLAVAIGIMTSFKFDSKKAAEEEARFVQCYSASGGNCVSDGDTIYVGGEKVRIAGIEAPKIDGSHCEAERNRGIDAATRLADLLNSGNVTVSRSFHEQSGREVRKVAVNGEDVGAALISGGVAREAGSNDPDWCAPADDGDHSE